MNEEKVNRIRNMSRSLFQSLRQIFFKQPEVRKLNLSQKRKPISLSHPSINSPKSNRKSRGTPLYVIPLLTTVSPTTSAPIPSQIEQIPSAPSQDPPPSSSSRRIVSNASIADPNQDSAGGARIWASTEKASDLFASNFMNYVVGWIWPSGITLDWVTGREGTSVLTWTSSYPPPVLSLCVCVFAQPSHPIPLQPNPLLL